MAGTVVLVLLGVTTSVAVLGGALIGRLSIAAFPRAFGQFFECIGLGCGFVLLNLTLGILGVLAIRTVFGAFVSLYYVNDIAFVALSLMQGVWFHAWRAASHRPGGR